VDEAASGVSVIVLFFFAIAGGLWIPPELFPSWLASMSHALPSYWGSELGLRIVDNQPFSATGLLVFAVWLVGAVFVAGWRFRKAS
jgi:ABC-2 type transport system permease protein